MMYYYSRHSMFSVFLFILLFGPVILVGAFKIIWWTASRWRIIRLMREGATGRAKVLSVAARGTAIIIEIEFFQDGGVMPIRVVKGFRLPPRLPVEGEEIMVRYDLKSPKHCVFVEWKKYQVDIYDIPGDIMLSWWPTTKSK